MRQERILAVVLAGGEGSRLRPLTQDQAKPAVPIGLGGQVRLVDFVLSNLVNSGIRSIYLLAQYKPESLIEHVQRTWGSDPRDAQHSVSIVLPSHERGGYYRGTADAVYQNLSLIERHRPDLVAVFAADHVYRMDVNQMVRFHRGCGADVTVAATQVPLESASSFGIIGTGDRGKIYNFQEKPASPIPISGDPLRAYASMGNYLFDPAVLVESLVQAARRGETDFGKHILPRLIDSHHVHAYDFSENSVPGIQPYEERAYWRDVGTLDAFAAAQQDMQCAQPRINLHNPHWPILPQHPSGHFRPTPMLA